MAREDGAFGLCVLVCVLFGSRAGLLFPHDEPSSVNKGKGGADEPKDGGAGEEVVSTGGCPIGKVSHPCSRRLPAS